eukprot:TRINITY_DN11322_c0_g1_i4.p1 TRINITY_DN11322_c0_g1~~TRINITY_DN11322_c0_g1_i4.p1  ORF type:complete len:519 (+),score=61.76 TRINITY_DN11322_c0_g1_i4:641-2197(+)
MASAQSLCKVRSFAFLRESMDVQQFAALVHWQTLAAVWENDEHRDAAWLLRDVLLKHAMDEICADHGQFDLPDLEEEILSPVSNSTDMLVLCLVFVNTITMALSSDFPDEEGLALLETVFVCIYAVEICMRLAIQGPCDFFRGKSALWNMFDLLVTLVSAVEEGVRRLATDSNNSAADSDAYHADVLRLVRLSRIGRIARLFRMGAMNEFRKMMYRIYSGMSSLFWASSVLLFIFFIISLVLRQTVGAQEIAMNDQYDTVLFSSVPWTFFSVFRMFMGDDALPNGTPMGFFLQDRYGLMFVLPYTVSYLLIVFGVFNTIAATFVEAVIESSAQQIEPTVLQRLNTVQLMRTVLLSMGESSIESPIVKTPRSWCWWCLAKVLRFNPESDRSDDITFVPFEGVVPYDRFMEASRSPKIKGLFEELGVRFYDPEAIFAALDHDYSRSLDTREFVRGVMQLRCNNIDRTDIVSTLLGVRTLHLELAEIKDMLSARSEDPCDAEKAVAGCLDLVYRSKPLSAD